MLRRRHIFETAVVLLAIALVPAEAQVPAQDTILTVAGGVPNNVSALSVSTEAQTIATDSEGNMYSSSPSLGLVTKISPSGQASTIAGDGSLGYGGDGAAATSAQIGCPAGIAVDAANDVFIADFCYNVIRRVNGPTGMIQTIAGDGSTGYLGDGGLATSAELNQPVLPLMDLETCSSRTRVITSFAKWSVQREPAAARPLQAKCPGTFIRSPEAVRQDIRETPLWRPMPV